MNLHIFYCIIATHIYTECMCSYFNFVKLPLLILWLNLFWQLLPKLKDLYSKIVNLSSAVTNAALEVVSDLLLKLADIVKEHEGEIKKIVHIFQEFVEGKVTLCLTRTSLCYIILLSSQYLSSKSLVFETNVLLMYCFNVTFAFSSVVKSWEIHCDGFILLW